MPDLAWSGDAFRDDRAIVLDSEGRQLRQVAKEGAEGTRLPGEALLPGFVNAHSHAFQIGLRGHGETFPSGQGSFWTWREAMYELVTGMTPDRLYASSKQAFDEMLAAGITSVGEFHYLHHLSDGLDFEGDSVVLDAAHDAGIGIVLLVVYYATGGIGQPLGPAQRRFATPDVESFWRHIDRLGGKLRSSRQSLGIAPHSIRAVPRDALRELWTEARRRSLPVHMHVEEQRREIEDCKSAFGMTPMEILLGDLAEAGGGLDGLTAVHCTHTPADQLARYFAAGGRACICPLTEGNLGDGLPSLAEALAEDPTRVGQVCLG
ncbi:MAG: amidohydrolase family protein, partial [Thermoanaerobaculia bacterium]|nr:amidohydrolase family protein [Thermoanaerobaculia bacterium]